MSGVIITLRASILALSVQGDKGQTQCLETIRVQKSSYGSATSVESCHPLGSDDGLTGRQVNTLPVSCLPTTHQVVQLKKVRKCPVQLSRIVLRRVA